MIHIPKFTPRKLPEHVPFLRQWIAYAIVFALVAPTALVLSQVFHGNVVAGMVGCLVWFPVLGYCSLALHRSGFVRLGVLIPLLAMVSAVLILAFAVA